MKKLSLLLAILLIVSFGVYADDPDATTGLEITTKVSTKSEVKIGNQEITVESFADFGEIGEVSEKVIDENSTTAIELAVYGISNHKGTFKISGVAGTLKGDTSAHILPYTIDLGDSNPLTVSTSTSFDFVTTSSTLGDSGLTFAEKDFAISIAADDWNAATADDYSATLTVNLTTI